MNESGEFEGWLEEALKRNLDPAVSRRARASRPRYRSLVSGGRVRRASLLGGGASTAAAAKAATGLTVAAFAVGATGAALSGTPNPIQWRQQVSHRVEQCQAGLSAESSGLGQCVSVFAGQISDQAAHPAAPTAAPETKAEASAAREIPPAPSAHGIIVVPKPDADHASGSESTPDPDRPPQQDKTPQPDPTPDAARPDQSGDIH